MRPFYHSRRSSATRLGGGYISPRLLRANKKFLVEAGLPKQYFPTWVSYQAFPHLPLLEELSIDTFSVPADFAHFRVLSLSRNTLPVNRDAISSVFCLDEHRDGQVVEVYAKGVVFLNSSIPQFAECLLVYNDYEMWVDERREERERGEHPFTFDQWKVKSQEMHIKLYEIDPDAFMKPEKNKIPIWSKILDGFEASIDWSP